MAAEEYVSVSSQADIERADLDREREGLANDRAYEHDELAAICVQRGLDTSLARQVAAQLVQHDALGAHARDELGISDAQSARPIQAACLRGNLCDWGCNASRLSKVVWRFDYPRARPR
jgi:VIT1/CCC1 family predicted Fe2+/Mn2+ transporter